MDEAVIIQDMRRSTSASYTLKEQFTIVFIFRTGTLFELYVFLLRAVFVPKQFLKSFFNQFCLICHIFLSTYFCSLDVVYKSQKYV